MLELEALDLDRVSGGAGDSAFSAVATRDPSDISMQVNTPFGSAQTGDFVGAMRELADFALGLPGGVVGAAGDVVDGLGDIANGLIPFFDPF